jgi:hypothetical protein
VFEQPVAGTQESVVQAVESSHVTVEPATHVPAVHVPAVIQASPAQAPTSQGCPSLVFECVQPWPCKHESAVHSFLSSQSSVPVPRQAPIWHVSPAVQGSVSSQGFVFGG